MDRITRLRIRNVRAIEALDLELGRPLTVLIGDNGAGKSTVIECLEILRKAAEPSFIERLYAIHRGLPALLRKGATELELGLVVEDDAGELPRIEYAFSLIRQGAGAQVERETLALGPTNAGEPFAILRRTPEGLAFFDERHRMPVKLSRESVRPDRLVLTSFGEISGYPAIDRLIAVLRGVEVHLPFDTPASWAARSYQRPESVRGGTTLFPAQRLSLLGVNLVNAWAELRNRPSAQWQATLELLKLGLGEQLDTVVATPDFGGGHVYLAVHFHGFAEPIFASDLSDGQLAWLAFVAMARLNPERALLAVDEPELHLHPALLGRVVELLSNLDSGTPVVLSTHSDRVLELVERPADAVRVLRLEGNRAVLFKLDPSELAAWLEDFNDLGALRANGYLSRVLVKVEGVEQG